MQHCACVHINTHSSPKQKPTSTKSKQIISVAAKSSGSTDLDSYIGSELIIQKGWYLLSFWEEFHESFPNEYNIPCVKQHQICTKIQFWGLYQTQTPLCLCQEKTAQPLWQKIKHAHYLMEEKSYFQYKSISDAYFKMTGDRNSCLQQTMRFQYLFALLSVHPYPSCWARKDPTA